MSTGGPDLRRLHPATILVEIPAQLKALIVPLLAVLLATRAGSSAKGFLILAGVGAGLSVLSSLARYLSLRYGVIDGALRIQSGIVFKRQRTIPVERIQNIDLQRGVVHRLFGVAEVRLETAGAEGSEAHLKVVGLDEAQLFRRRLLRLSGRDARRADDDADDDERGDAELFRARLPELMLAGATENRVGVIIGALFGVTELAGLDVDDAVRRAWRLLSSEVDGLGEANRALVGIAAGLALVFAGWIVSIALTVTKHYGFRLTRRDDELRCRYGLFTTIEAVVPLARLQLLRLVSNPLHRLTRMTVVEAETAGAAAEQQRGGHVTLSPLMRRAATPGLCAAIREDLSLEALALRRVHPASLDRGIKRYVLGLLALSLPPALIWGGRVWWAPAAALPLAVLLGWLRYRALGWARSSGYLAARAGIWTRRLWIVPESKIQSVSVRSTPFQRRRGLATLHVGTAGAGALSHARVVDLDAELAESLREELARRSNRSGLLRGGI